MKKRSKTLRKAYTLKKPLTIEIDPELFIRNNSKLKEDLAEIKRNLAFIPLIIEKIDKIMPTTSSPHSQYRPS